MPSVPFLREAANRFTAPRVHRTLVTIGPEAAEQRGGILEPLRAFNLRQAPAAGAEPLCISIRDAGDCVVGGLYGTMVYDWLAIELLIIPEEIRGEGLGSKLIGQAEEQARIHGCIGAWLDTFSFQARGFYEKLGYEVAGTIPDHPLGGARYFLTKRWA